MSERFLTRDQLISKFSGMKTTRELCKDALSMLDYNREIYDLYRSQKATYDSLRQKYADDTRINTTEYTEKLAKESNAYYDSLRLPSEVWMSMSKRDKTIYSANVSRSISKFRLTFNAMNSIVIPKPPPSLDTLLGGIDIGVCMFAAKLIETYDEVITFIKNYGGESYEKVFYDDHDVIHKLAELMYALGYNATAVNTTKPLTTCGCSCEGSRRIVTATTLKVSL